MKFVAALNQIQRQRPTVNNLDHDFFSYGASGVLKVPDGKP